MSDYNPYTDGPAEPIGLAMDANGNLPPSSLAAMPGSEVKCKCADCGKEIIYSTIQLCDDCYNYRSDTAAMEDDDSTCDRCGGDGEILICCDDICHGLGECIHGDGYAACPDCKGTGEIPRANPPNVALSGVERKP